MDMDLPASPAAIQSLLEQPPVIQLRIHDGKASTDQKECRK